MYRLLILIILTSWLVQCAEPVEQPAAEPTDAETAARPERAYIVGTVQSFESIGPRMWELILVDTKGQKQSTRYMVQRREVEEEIRRQLAGERREMRWYYDLKSFPAPAGEGNVMLPLVLEVTPVRE